MAVTPTAPSRMRSSTDMRAYRAYAGPMDTPTEITCPECQGTVHRVSFPPEEGFEPGDVVAYVCEDCGARFDIVVEETEDEPPSGGIA